MHKGGGDDSLSGPLLPRFWTVGDQPDHAAMQLAAAALVANNAGIKDLLPDLRAAWEKAPAGDAKLNLALVLANGYYTVEDAAHLREMAAEILKSYPDSYTAIGLAASADEMLKDWDSWKQMLDAQLSKHPADETLLRMKTRYFEARGAWPDARATLQLLVDKGKATASDYNSYGWLALFDRSINDDAIKLARQAVNMTNNNSFNELHTLACLYAAQGKNAEARDLLLKAMRIYNMAIPNEELWFGFGTLYEQYGMDDAAIEAYQKVEKPMGQIGPTSTYLLAQARLGALKGGK
jgi:tetratricopeptide (TPR) repeat protein